MGYDRTTAMVPGEMEDRTPSATEAHFAGEEANTLCGLLYLAAGNIEGHGIIDDDCIPHGALMLDSKISVMRAFIAKKSEEEHEAQRAKPQGLKVAARK